MAKNVSDRKNMSANNRPFSLKATKKTQKVNLQTVKIDGKKVRLTTKEIRSRKINHLTQWFFCVIILVDGGLMGNKKKFLALVFALIFVLSVNNKIDTLHKEKETLKKEETMTLKKRKF